MVRLRPRRHGVVSTELSCATSCFVVSDLLDLGRQLRMGLPLFRFPLANDIRFTVNPESGCTTMGSGRGMMGALPVGTSFAPSHDCPIRWKDSERPYTWWLTARQGRVAAGPTGSTVLEESFPELPPKHCCKHNTTQHNTAQHSTTQHKLRFDNAEPTTHSGASGSSSQY